MNRIAAVVATMLLPTVLAGCSTMPPDPTAELLGQWSMVTRIGQGRMDATMTIDRADDGTLSGSWESRGMRMDLLDISLEESSVRFDREIPGGELLRFTGTIDNDTIEGVWSGSFGEATSSGTRIIAAVAAAGDSGEVGKNAEGVVPNQHSRPMKTQDSRTLLWARGDDDTGDVEWFDLTDSTIDPRTFQFGVGKDTIASIDEPEFRSFDDPLIAERGITVETPVLGVYIDGVARAYPVDVMSMHEIVNDEIAGKPYAVLW